jgi:hypothetical protein
VRNATLEPPDISRSRCGSRTASWPLSPVSVPVFSPCRCAAHPLPFEPPCLIRARCGGRIPQTAFNRRGIAYVHRLGAAAASRARRRRRRARARVAPRKRLQPRFNSARSQGRRSQLESRHRALKAIAGMTGALARAAAAVAAGALGAAAAPLAAVGGARAFSASAAAAGKKIWFRRAAPAAGRARARTHWYPAAAPEAKKARKLGAPAAEPSRAAQPPPNTPLLCTPAPAPHPQKQQRRHGAARPHPGRD